MIDVREHVYDDDPGRGPADVRTELPGVDYFFLGNGLIQAAVQISPKGEGTAVGLLVMDPDRLRKKREALTMDPDYGLAATMARLVHEDRCYAPRSPSIRARWDRGSAVPAVVVRWRSGPFRVEERFSCPSRTESSLVRTVQIRNFSRRPARARLTTGVPGVSIEKDLVLAPGARRTFFVQYRLERKSGKVRLAFIRNAPSRLSAERYWRGLAEVSFGEARLDHFFQSSTRQLPAAVSRRGVLDGSIWQYNREWCRDQSMIAVALTMTGETALAGTILRRLLTSFVTDAGDTVDSSVRRDPDEIELDQNGFLLAAVRDHALWTGRSDIVREHWAKIIAAAEFPLGPVFRHARSGLLLNRREFWERHRAHGIKPGLELAHQLYVSYGLDAAAALARLTGDGVRAGRWATEALRIRTAFLQDPRFGMADGRGFIKRRGPDGRIQETITPRRGAGLPGVSPLAQSGLHYLNPDTSAVLPIALCVVPSDSPLVRPTLRSMEALWSQAWSGGGYGRYHVTSEPDSPGGWPFASLFVARAAVEAGEPATVRRVLDWLGAVAGSGAGSWFEFYGKRASPPFPQVGIIPWTWAEIVVLCVHHLLGFRPTEAGLTLRPRLLPGHGRVRAELPFRGRRHVLEYRTSPRTGRLEARLGGRSLKTAKGMAYTREPSWTIVEPF